MKTKTIFGVAIGMLCIGLLLWLGVYAYHNIPISTTPIIPSDQPAPAVTAFLVVKPNFVVDGFSLSKVEIWGIPDVLLGNAELQAGEDSMSQIWTLPVPKEPLALTGIIAKGFGPDGILAQEMPLPYIGTVQIHNLLWENDIATTTSVAPNFQKTFSSALKVGEKRSVGELSLKLIKIISDSRCPANAVCVWAGEVTAQIQVATTANNSKTVTMRSMDPAYRFGNYEIKMTDVVPARGGTPPTKEDYRITFSIQRL